MTEQRLYIDDEYSREEGDGEMVMRVLTSNSRHGKVSFFFSLFFRLLSCSDDILGSVRAHSQGSGVVQRWLPLPVEHLSRTLTASLQVQRTGVELN